MFHARLELVVFGTTDVFVTVDSYVHNFFGKCEVRKERDINRATLTLAR